MILPRHWTPEPPGETTHAGADCCGKPCQIVFPCGDGRVIAPRTGAALDGIAPAMWLCLTCGATVRQCGGGKRCVLPLGHQALPDFSCHESKTGSRVPA